MARAGLQHPKTNIPSCFTIFLGSIVMWKTPNDRPKYGTMVYNTLKLTKLPPKSGVHKTFAKVTHISICSLNLINPNWEYGIGFTRQMNMFPSTICRSCFEEETHGRPHLFVYLRVSNIGPKSFKTLGLTPPQKPGGVIRCFAEIRTSEVSHLEPLIIIRVCQ